MHRPRRPQDTRETQRSFAISAPAIAINGGFLVGLLTFAALLA